jgi:hypothetical protein
VVLDPAIDAAIDAELLPYTKRLIRDLRHG